MKKKKKNDAGEIMTRIMFHNQSLYHNSTILALVTMATAALPT
jgi:TfoX/Sxy family transcriptional regulator of competence genes